MHIPLFIINLEKDSIKQRHMSELCAKYNLTPEFISAVDGNCLSLHDINSVYRKKQAVANIGRGLSRGEIGCAFSHKSVYSRMLNEDIPAAIVFEDDVDFNEALLKFFKIVSDIPKNCELLLLGHHSGRSRSEPADYSLWYKLKMFDQFILRRPCELACGTYGYYITRRGAKKMIENLRHLNLPLDHYTGSDKYINLFILQHPIVSIQPELTTLSNLDHGRLKMEKISAFQQRNSLKKRLAQYLGVYDFLNYSIEKIKLLHDKIRPLNCHK